MEIHRLHEMLNKAGIPHEFRDRTPLGGNEYSPRHGIKWGYLVIVYYPDGECMVSAIEGAGSYGFGGWDHGMVGTDEKDGDLIEIMGLLTPEEEKHDSVVGYLTAEDVFLRIQKEIEKCSRR